mgnify:CR=1 FL=1|tara:strand:+ start:995 stop:1339 length:345 start_codon:yes stop_codon:yes gene_type:complete
MARKYQTYDTIIDGEIYEVSFNKNKLEHYCDMSTSRRGESHGNYKSKSNVPPDVAESLFLFSASGWDPFKMMVNSIDNANFSFSELIKTLANWKAEGEKRTLVEIVKKEEEMEY